MNKIIDRFTNEYRFLSNFYPCQITYEDMIYPSVEHAFQAAKCLTIMERKKIQAAQTAGLAKKMGRKVNLRNDWERVKIDIMRIILKNKFTNSTLQQLLLNTGSAQLIEGNNWHDTFWGKCNGKGQNQLGKLLMEIRDGFKTIDSMVNDVKSLPSPKEKLQMIRKILHPITLHFYNDAPDQILVAKKELAALFVLVVNNQNWE